MELGIAFVIGGLCGWLLGRATRSSASTDRKTFRPNKRQRKILATLPPDPVRPSIQELVIEEANALGVDQIPGAEDVPLAVRLKVWKRDQPALGGCETGDLRFSVRSGVGTGDVTDADVRLECHPASDDSDHS